MPDLVPIPLDLFDRLERAGLDVEAILRSARLPRSRSSVPNPQGTTAEFFALWRAVEEQSDDPSLGLRIGVEVLPDESNVVSLAAMHAATLGEGLRKLARYKRLVCPEQITIDVANGEARLRFEWVLAHDTPPTLVTDIVFAGVTNLAQRGTNTPVRPRRLEFIRRRANEALLRRHFRCALRFGAPYDVLVFEGKRARLADGPAQCPASLRSGAWAGGGGRTGPARADARRRRTRSPQRNDLRRPSRHREGGEVSRNERAHDAAPPRRPRHDVPGRSR